MTAPRQFTYEDALKLAATMSAGAATADVVTGTVSSLTDQTAAVRERAVAWATRAILQLWDAVAPYDGDSVSGFATEAAKRMSIAQTSIARSVGASMTQQLSIMNIHTPAVASTEADVRRLDPVNGILVERPDTAHVDYAQAPEPVKLAAATDSAADNIFNRPARAYRYAVSTDVNPQDADAAAQKLIAVMVDENAMMAARLAAAEVMQKTVDLDVPGPKIIGYRRVIHPELSRTGTCGLCIAASDRLYHVADLMPIHARCKCEVAAVTSEHDPGKRLNDADLADLYRAAGGYGGDPTTSAPALKRVRYRIDEHGELGPVLVPRNARKPRKAFTSPRRTARANAP